jgi:hypothetical protein
MKQLETYIIEKLKIRHPVYDELGLDLFNNVKSEADFNNNANELLNTLLDISENIYDGPNTTINADNYKYILIVKDNSTIIFVGDNSKDECFLLAYNTTLNSIMIPRLVKNITSFIPKEHKQSNLYVFKFNNELDVLLKYCEKYAD